MRLVITLFCYNLFNMNKQGKEKCLLIWGCIPKDEYWALNSTLFIEYQSSNNLSSPSIVDINRKRELQSFFQSKHINFL